MVDNIKRTEQSLFSQVYGFSGVHIDVAAYFISFVWGKFCGLSLRVSLFESFSKWIIHNFIFTGKCIVFI